MSTLQTLLEITIYSAALFVLIILFRALLKKHMSPVLLYSVWFLLIARLLVPVTWDAGFHILSAPAQTQAVDVTALLDELNHNVMINQSGAAQRQLNDIPTSEGSKIQAQNSASTPAKPESIQQTPFSWDTALIVLWLSGAGILLFLTVLSSIQLKRRIRRGFDDVPPEWRQMAQQIACELHIRRKIRMAVVGGFPTPALSAGPRPIVVLPKELNNEEAVRFALRHELTHLKRGDHIVCLMMLILRAVYWFHPVVWAAAKLMRLDMETACDSTVTRQMCAGSKTRYAQAILSMHLKPQLRYALGMALGSTKKTVERRIKGIFMRSKTGNKARFVALILTAVMVAACFTTACQPTPEEPVVVQRDALEEKITETEETAVPEATYEAPNHWTDSAEKGAMIINIDAAVVMPEVSAYPVIKLEPHVFSQERVDELVHYFAGDRKLYQPNLLTKKDYEDALIQAKRGQEIDGEYVVTEDTKRVVAELEETINNAPEDSPKIYTDSTLTYKTNTDGTIDSSTSKNYLDVQIEGDTGPDSGCIYFRNFVDGESNLTEFSYLTTTYMAESFARSFVEKDQRMQKEYDPEYLEKDTMKSNEERYQKLMSANISIIKDEAQAVAQKAIDELNIQDMYLITAERALLDPYHGLPSDGSDKGGYVFEYVRQSGGIAGFIRRSWSGNPSENPPEYRPPFEQESVTVVVTDDGIESFLWIGCAQVIETASENVELLPFEDVIERLEERIFIERAYEAGFDTTQTITINVDTAELRVGYIDVKDELNQALLVPVWMFQTTGALTANDGRTFTDMMDEIYIFNAIDGGYIHESFG